MARKRRRRTKKKKPSSAINWQFKPDVPVYDIFKYDREEKGFAYEMAFDDFIYTLKAGEYLLWEAVISKEQNLPLNEEHKKALGELLYFGDKDPEDRILYIDEMPRPKEPWYEVATKIFAGVLVEPFNTKEGMSSVIYEGWEMLVDILKEQGQHLSLPKGVKNPLKFLPVDIDHLLHLHLCFDALFGLGQEEELTLANPEQCEYRMKWFLDCIKEHKDTLQFFNLSLNSLLSRIIMPAKDEEIFIRLMTKELGLPSLDVKLADYL